VNCEHPLRAYYTHDGAVRPFKRTDKQYNVEPYTGLQLSCGKCILCRKRQASDTTTKIVHEASQHLFNSFVTLTYDDKHIPEHGSLDYRHLQLLWKRLRNDGLKFKYYAVGEYGDSTQRPHYHACVFGEAFTKDRVITTEAPFLNWTSPQLLEAWGLGLVSVGALTPQSAAYVAGYVVKKLGKQQYVRLDEQSGELIAVEQPRAFASQGLARAWWNQWHTHVEQRDRVYVAGRHKMPPRTYDRWLGETNKEALIDIKLQRELRAEKAAKKSKDQIRARARNAHAHVQAKRKTL